MSWGSIVCMDRKIPRKSMRKSSDSTTISTTLFSSEFWPISLSCLFWNFSIIIWFWLMYNSPEYSWKILRSGHVTSWVVSIWHRVCTSRYHEINWKLTEWYVAWPSNIHLITSPEISSKIPWEFWENSNYVLSPVEFRSKVMLDVDWRFPRKDASVDFIFRKNLLLIHSPPSPPASVYNSIYNENCGNFEENFEENSLGMEFSEISLSCDMASCRWPKPFCILSPPDTCFVVDKDRKDNILIHNTLVLCQFNLFSHSFVAPVATAIVHAALSRKNTSLQIFHTKTYLCGSATKQRKKKMYLDWDYFHLLYRLDIVWFVRFSIQIFLDRHIEQFHTHILNLNDMWVVVDT